FVFGGRGSAGALASIERASIMPDGTLGPFAVIGANLATARAGLASRVLGDAVWLVGGETQAGAVPNVDMVTLAGDQVVSVSDAGRALAVPRRNHTLEVLANSLCAIGGDATGQSLEAATIGASPSIGSIANQAKTLAQTGPMVVLGNWLYV